MSNAILGPLQTPYNTQRDNIPIKESWDTLGVFYGWAQCGPTSACMLLSQHIPEAASDQFVASYITACEPQGPGPAIYVADIKAAYPQVSGRYTAWMVTHRWMIQKLLTVNNVQGVQMVYREDSIGWRPDDRQYGTWDDVRGAIASGFPVIIHGNPPPSEGHFFVVVGESDDGWICHDPYGDARKQYEPWAKLDGKHVEYSKSDMSKWCSMIGPDKLRILHGMNV